MARAATSEVWRASGFVTEPPRAARARSAGARRWALFGALLGAAVGALSFAPASWLASAVAHGTDQRLLLADVRGTVWSGSAVPVLTGGPGSRSAATLPGRLRWSLAWNDGAWEVQLRHPCCLRGVPRVRVSPDWPRLRVTLTPDPVVGAPPTAPGGGPAVGQWPAAWLAGLGTPWNTVQLDGLLRLSTPGLALERTRQGWRVEGRALLDAVELASRLSTLPTLGSYRLEVTGAGDDGVRLSLQTLSGALRLHADGGWLGGRLRLRGEAEAAHGAESALDNLLNLIGRRQGARSIIAIG